MKVSVRPELLRWARERASLDRAELARRVGLKPQRVAAWEQSGELSLAHLERIASKTHTPVGYLFLSEPPIEALPIPDFRTIAGGKVEHPSPDLLDTLYQCQRQQDWFRDYLLEQGEDPLPFVGSAKTSDRAEAVAGNIREAIRLAVEERASLPTWEEALRDMVERTEEAGLLVMRNGVVGNNTHRKLDVQEFRGFVLADQYAPLIFVNAADAKAAQMFTLAHELAHVWLGQSGVSDARVGTTNSTERFCNAVAAEVLVPLDHFRTDWRRGADPTSEAQRLSRRFKVSTLVILIRARQAGVLQQDEFDILYAAERERVRDSGGPGGGDFYRTQSSRLGKRFTRAVIASALEGQTLFRDAFQLLGLRRATSFEELARRVGVAGA